MGKIEWMTIRRSPSPKLSGTGQLGDAFRPRRKIKERASSRYTTNRAFGIANVVTAPDQNVG
jgi:hypothetical protein